MKLILGLTGEKAGGKGTIAAYCREKYNASSYRFSDVLFDILRLLDVEPSRQNLIMLSGSVRRDFGETILARALGRKVTVDNHALIVVDGIRRLGDIETLRTLSGFHLVHVTADVRLRYERSTQRGEKAGDATQTFEQFVAEEDAETEKSIRETAALAESRITNNGTADELYRSIDRFINHLEQTKAANPKSLVLKNYALHRRPH